MGTDCLQLWLLNKNVNIKGQSGLKSEIWIRIVSAEQKT